MASSRSIRFKISALLVIPLLSLAALWVFGASVTTRESVNLLTVASLYQKIGRPGDELTIALQREHVLSAEYVSTLSERAQNTLVRQRQVVDGFKERMRKVALSETTREDLSTPAMRTRFDDLMARIGRLDSTRAAVDSGSVDLVTLTNDFSQVPDAMQKLINSMTLTNDLPLYQQSRSLTAMGYSKDFLSRERALASGAFIAGRSLSPAELRLFAELATTRRFLFDQGLLELDPEISVPFQKLMNSEAYTRFAAIEAQIVSAQGRRFSHEEWRELTDEVETTYQATLTTAGAALAAAAQPSAIGTFVRAGLAGALGLIAVVASLIISLRVGRSLTRELGALRAAAADLATIRLPRLIERLRRGEDVDVETEAPPLALTATTTEVRDVSAAFASVQRTAVEAAVEQSMLHHAVGDAFRNLARRSRLLLQRQLKLLDGMQRRVEEPETLRDLFRVDHLTTRMRRHAEGLVILSGGSPGRTFRHEVPVMDALRAAVGEIEDYTRVRVHPMPEASIAGSAVADVIHLCAELVENATTFSPPNTEVSVRGDLVARGFAVEVEDRGLGMSNEDRDALNEKLSRPPTFDPADTERLGLFVIGRLAARHGIRVELRGSPYGGTTAIALIPENLVSTTRQAPEAAKTLPTRPSRGPQRPARRQPTGGTPSSGAGGLPRRVRQANLAPQLKQGAEEKGSTLPDGSAESGAQTSSNGAVETGGQARPASQERSPERSRALLNALQSGWRRGRAESERDGEEV